MMHKQRASDHEYKLAPSCPSAARLSVSIIGRTYSKWIRSFEASVSLSSVAAVALVRSVTAGIGRGPQHDKLDIGFGVAKAALFSGASVIIASSSQEKVDGAVKRLSNLGTNQSVEGRVCNVTAGETAMKDFFEGLPEFNHLSTMRAFYHSADLSAC
jgi:hypothetical protein